jgi:Ca2+-transporting ATPase
MIWFTEDIVNIIKKINTNIQQGLTQSEAEDRLILYGENQFREEKNETILQKIGHHLAEITTIILLIAAGISAYMAITLGYGWPKVFVILSIIVLNIILGVSQENKAEKSLDALKNMNANYTTVIRDGLKSKIYSTKLVVGDIIELNAGDMIPADARLIESNSLLVEESALTGESIPVEKDTNSQISKDAPLGDRLNMIYSGCLIANGRAKAVVVETGMNTEMGKIADLLNNTSKLITPLQIRLRQLAKRLSIVALLAGILIFLVGVYIHGETLVDMLLIAISLSVAAVPETLPVIVTIILAYGVQNMVKKNTIIRQISAVETIGNTSVICSDKTGTLTQNKMIIRQIWHVNSEPSYANQQFTSEESSLLEMLAACTNATIETDNGEEKIIGDPTEVSIIRLLLDIGIKKSEVEQKYPRVYELPFDSNRKLMTTIHQVDDGFLAITKGAFDRIPVHFNEDLLQRSTKVHDSFAEQALRVIAIGYKKYNTMPSDLNAESLEHDLTFLGMVGMIDPPRPESKQAVYDAKAAGIKTVMITGDHVVTASAIAKEIGIMNDGDRSLTGSELSQMSEGELKNQVKDISVYARVSPEDKIRIVQAWQSHGEVITMTGDGVNDAPALKAADVGAAMGITGTDVSKNAADMVITDDNFATIVDAVSEGRTAYDNIRKTVSFLLSVNFAEILIMLIGIIVGWGPPVIAIQLLLINVVSDGIPGFFLSVEKPDKDIMTRKPLKKNSGIFAAGLGKTIAQRMTIFVIITLTGFYIGQFVKISNSTLPSYEVGMTMAFIILSWSSVLNIFNVRSNESIFKIGFLSNTPLFYATIFSILFSAFIVLFKPLANIFQLVPISYIHWMFAIALSMVQLIFVEIQKFIQSRS